MVKKPFKIQNKILNQKDTIIKFRKIFLVNFGHLKKINNKFLIEGFTKKNSEKYVLFNKPFKIQNNFLYQEAPEKKLNKKYF